MEGPIFGILRYFFMLAFRRSDSIQRFIYFFNFFVFVVVRKASSSLMLYRIELRHRLLLKSPPFPSPPRLK